MGIHTRCDTACAWFYEKADLDLMLAVYESLGVRVTWERNRDYNGEWYTVRVVDRVDAWRAREIRRGLKVAATLRGDVYDFLEVFAPASSRRERLRQANALEAC